MATSGTTAWSLTARDIINTALMENAIISPDEQPTADEARVCLIRLNALLKSWHVGLYLEEERTQVITAGSKSVVLDGDIETVVGARLVQSATNERPLARWERDDYLSLPNKASRGTPSVFYASEGAEQTTLYVWPVPVGSITLKLDCLRKPETITDLGQTVDFPQRYQEALYAVLAVRCAGIFGAQPSQELVVRSERLRIEVEDAERPSAYTFGYC